MNLPMTTQNFIMHFPKRYGEYELIDLHMEMINLQAQYVAQHLRNRDTVSTQIQINADVLQEEAGINFAVSKNMSTMVNIYMPKTLLG